MRRRLLERLEERVRAFGLETVRAVHDARLPAALERGLPHRVDHARAHRLDRDDAALLLRRQAVDVGMRPQVAVPVQQLQDAVGQLAGHAAHPADDEIAVRGSPRPHGLLDLRVCLVNGHGRPSGSARRPPRAGRTNR